jgi:hypothetical protein
MMPRDRDGQTLTARYEDLRRWALTPDGTLPHPRGLALLLQQSVPAWIRAWMARVSPQPVASVEAPSRLDGPLSPAPAVGPALVVLLSTMALACRREDPPCSPPPE